jgi:hypothetical protein
MITDNDNPISKKEDTHGSEVQAQLRDIVERYLEQHPRLSTNGLSRKCQVSEPTLRRLISGQTKGAPRLNTVLSLLTYLSGKTKIRDIAHTYGGAVESFLLENVTAIDYEDQEFSNEINEELKDPVRYLIFKLALNASGVHPKKIEELFGAHGITQAEHLLDKGFIYIDTKGFVKTKIETYRASFDDFVKNFKSVANYIKPDKLKVKDPLNPYFLNKSDSINSETYQQIRKILKKTQEKIDRLVAEPEAKGEIPFFLLSALDTLDTLSARDLEDQNL